MIATVIFTAMVAWAFGYFFGEIHGRAQEFQHTAELIDSIESLTLKPGARQDLLTGAFRRRR